MSETRYSSQPHRRKQRYPLFFGFDWTLILIVVILLIFGLIMLYSASSYNAQLKFDSSAWYVKKQLTAIGLGIAAMAIVAYIPHSFLKKISIIAYIVAVLAVLAVRSSLGVEANGAKRWLDLKVMSVQPSEILKIALILIMAYVICKRIKDIKNWKTYAIVFGLDGFAALLVVVITDDLGTGIIIFLMGIVMILVASPDWKHLAISAGVVLACGFAAVMMEPYRLERFRAWQNLEAYSDDAGYQIIQGLYAIGSGGLFGKGLGKSTQKLGFVPESQNDMIFSIICEELGIIGGIILICLFVMMIWRLKTIYDGSNDLYSKVVVAGVSAHIAIQTIINIAVVTSSIPNTGVPLPFISYGGTAVIFQLAEIGLVLSVARENEIRALENLKFRPRRTVPAKLNSMR